MAPHGLTAWLVIGVVAGWLAGILVKDGGFGILADIVVGIVGAFIGGWLAGVLGISLGGGWIGSIITTVIDAMILPFIIRLIKRAQRAPVPVPRMAVDVHVIQPPDFNTHCIAQTG